MIMLLLNRFAAVSNSTKVHSVPRNHSRADLRQRIVEAATAIVGQKGFSATGLAEVLKAADVSKGAFYHHFDSKEVLGEAMVDANFERYTEYLGCHLRHPHFSALARVIGYWQAWAEAQYTDGAPGKCLAVKLGAEVADAYERMRAALQRGTDSVICLLAAAIQRGFEDGSIARSIGEPTQIAIGLHSLWFGAALQHKIRRDRRSFESALVATLQILSP